MTTESLGVILGRSLGKILASNETISNSNTRLKLVHTTEQISRQIRQQVKASQRRDARRAKRELSHAAKA